MLLFASSCATQGVDFCSQSTRKHGQRGTDCKVLPGHGRLAPFQASQVLARPPRNPFVMSEKLREPGQGFQFAKGSPLSSAYIFFFSRLRPIDAQLSHPRTTVERQPRGVEGNSFHRTSSSRYPIAAVRVLQLQEFPKGAQFFRGHNP